MVGAGDSFIARKNIFDSECINRFTVALRFTLCWSGISSRWMRFCCTQSSKNNRATGASKLSSAHFSHFFKISSLWCPHISSPNFSVRTNRTIWEIIDISMLHIMFHTILSLTPPDTPIAPIGGACPLPEIIRGSAGPYMTEFTKAFSFLMIN